MENAIFWLGVLTCVVALSFDMIFIVSLIALIFSKKSVGYYKKTASAQDDYHKYVFYCCYEVTYRNIFPAQDTFKDKVYPKDKPVKIRIIPKFKLAIDKVTMITIWIGVIFSAVFSCFAYHVATNILF